MSHKSFGYTTTPILHSEDNDMGRDVHRTPSMSSVHERIIGDGLKSPLIISFSFSIFLPETLSFVSIFSSAMAPKGEKKPAEKKPAKKAPVEPRPLEQQHYLSHSGKHEDSKLPELDQPA